MTDQLLVQGKRHLLLTSVLISRLSTGWDLEHAMGSCLGGSGENVGSISIENS